MNPAEKLTEPEIRALRDAIYGPQTEQNWQGCRENWMRKDSVRWLLAKNAVNWFVLPPPSPD